MAMATAKLVLLVALLAGSSFGASSSELRGLWTRAERAVEAAAERFVEEDVAAPVIHALRPLYKRGGVAWCDSWRLAVETGNKRDWETVPKKCELYVGNYMVGGHYRRDSIVIVDEAIAYAQGFKLRGNADKKLVWIFGVEETSISSLPYYAIHGFGTQPFNVTSFREYVLKASSPVLPETQRLYNTVVSLGIKPVFLSTRPEIRRAVTEANLRQEGYSDWMELLLKPVDCNCTDNVYKSGERKKLQDAAYLIVGNIGDQWSDILGQAEGTRTFKLPNPLYYIP